MARKVLTGGDKLARFIVDKKRQLAAGRGRTVGFHDRRIAALAATHEYGLGNNPMRPAFAQSMPEVKRAWTEATRDAGKAIADPKARDREIEHALDAGAVAAREAVKQRYRDFQGEPLSEAQKARKRGTPGEGRQLTGHRGERLIDHIEAHDDTGEVDG